MADLASGITYNDTTPPQITISAVSELVFCASGVAERGPIGSSPLVTSLAEWKRVYGGFSPNTLKLAAAMQAYYDNGGKLSRTSRVTHVTTPGDPDTTTSSAGSLTLNTAENDPTLGAVSSSVQPFDLEPGQDLVVAFEAGGDQTFTINAAAAARVSAAEPFALANGQQLQIAINGGATKTKTFATGEFVDITQATAEEVVASLNAFFAAQELPCVATLTDSDTTVTITTNRRGTGAIVNVVGGTANTALAYTTGALAGTGNVSNVDTVTAAEIATICAAITNGTVSSTGGVVTFTSGGTPGPTSTAQVKAVSTADTAMGFDNAIHAGSDGSPVATWVFTGKTHFDATAYDAVTTTASNGDALSVDLEFRKNGARVEKFSSVSADPASPRFVETVLHDEGTGSALFTVEDQGVGLPPALGSADFTGGNDGLVGLVDSDYLGATTTTGATGLRVFDRHDDVMVVAVPGRGTSAVHNGIVTYCDIVREGEAFALLDPPQDLTAEAMRTYVLDTAALKDLSTNSSIYWPEVKVLNPDTETLGTTATVTIPPSGMVAGVAARVEGAGIGGAFDQPAGADPRYLPRGILGFATPTGEPPSKPERERLFPANINPISREGDSPPFIDGARTLSIAGNWPSVGQSRGAMYVKRKVRDGLRAIRHRNINEDLYEKCRRTVFQFLKDLTDAGRLKSKDPTKAFFVDFGVGLNPPSVQAKRQVRGNIGLATSEPAEFIVIEIGPDTRALDEEAASAA